MIYLKVMNRLKKFWIVFLSFLPFGAGAVSPFVIGGIAGVATIAGFSIYRSMAPVNMEEALKFFSSCWSCQMFSDIMSTMSGLITRVYSAIGHTIVPVAVILTAVWFTWVLMSNFINSKWDKPWDIATTFGNHIFKLGFVCALLLAPLPRMITDVAIEPIFNVGLTLNRMTLHDDKFDECVVATALADPSTIQTNINNVSNKGAFSPKLRHNLTCELGGVHQMTGLGMAIGWAMLNMSFNVDYMHKIMWAIPIFPNVILFFAGALVLILFFMALLPIPMYFLEVFIKLSMDLVMLPLMLLAWLFKDWKISLAGVGTSLKSIINNVISATLGIAMTGVFVSFAIMFLNAVFGDWGGASALNTALTQNDSKFLMDALMMKNDSLITIILMGLFMAMFMTMIPALVKTLFNVQISTEYYDKLEKDLKILWENGKKWYEKIKK